MSDNRFSDNTVETILVGPIVLFVLLFLVHKHFCNCKVASINASNSRNTLKSKSIAARIIAKGLEVSRNRKGMRGTVGKRPDACNSKNAINSRAANKQEGLQ
jgi:hypothetical protein